MATGEATATEASTQDAPEDESVAVDASDDEKVVHFWFPVTVEVIGAPDPELSARVVARVFDELNRELESRA